MPDFNGAPRREHVMADKCAGNQLYYWHLEICHVPHVFAEYEHWVEIGGNKKDTKARYWQAETWILKWIKGFILNKIINMNRQGLELLRVKGVFEQMTILKIS